MPARNAPFGRIRANNVTNQDLEDAGIPGFVISDDGTNYIELDDSASNDQFAEAATLAGEATALLGTTPYVSTERAELTDAWLALKASLDAIPAAPDVGDDPYAEVRVRVAAKVQLALDAVTNAGGVG